MGFGASLPSCHEKPGHFGRQAFHGTGNWLKSQDDRMQRPDGLTCLGRRRITRRGRRSRREEGMNILPAGSASRHWLGAGLALGLAATCQAGMVVRTDPPDEQARPASRPTSAPATVAAPAPPASQAPPAKSAAPAASRPPMPAAPAPAAQRSNPARAKHAPPAAEPPQARSGNRPDRAGWPACLRLLNAAALSDDWDDGRRQALLEQCP